MPRVGLDLADEAPDCTEEARLPAPAGGAHEHAPDSKPGETDRAEGLAAAAGDAVGPVCGATAIVFALFVVFNWLDLPPRAVRPVVAHDMALVVLFGSAWLTMARRRLPTAWVHVTGFFIGALVLSNILLTTWLLREVFYTNYVLIVIVGIGALMPSSRWAVASLLLTCAAWGATVWPFTTPKQFVHLAFTVLGACGLSLALHLARRRTQVRLLGLHHVDAIRKVALERALREAERSRDELDRRVEERTRELSTANERLLVDIAARKAAEARIEFMAHHDALTGLPNRIHLRERFAHAVAQTRPDKGRVALLFLDLDRFKTINDSLGHSAGDDLLRGMSDRLRRCVRYEDTVCRQGGDEFLIVLGGIGERAEVEEVCARILEGIAEPFAWEGRALPTSCSIGIAMYPDDGDDFGTLLKKADIAMYQSKARGRNGFAFHGSESGTINMLDNLDLENRLRGALERRELSLCYQPIVELATRRVVGAEALLRWTCPDRGPIPPARFIPMAEESGLIVPIGQWVLEEACREAKGWQREGRSPVKVAVNISGIQFLRTDLAQAVDTVLARSGLPANALELEITESILITHVERSLEAIRRIQARGVSLAVDDFGTGFSSLAYLKRFHVDTLKVDQSFVRDVVHDSEGASIVRAIIDLGRSLSLHTLAEGVERQDQADHLQAAGCRFAQGYLFARPLPAHEFRAFLEASRERYRSVAPVPVHASA